jgi:D-alanyl-D-alanine carboxypeptidase/D-alanyl-D-alanine-endopeptidase (penicillin-binding protein 4)
MGWGGDAAWALGRGPGSDVSAYTDTSVGERSSGLVAESVSPRMPVVAGLGACRGAEAVLRAGLALLAALCTIAGGSPAAHAASALPPEVRAALQRARVPEGALAVVVQEAGSGQTLLSHQPRLPVNPASLAKLLTTYAALDLLGPAWTWTTSVAWSGPLRDGVLEGDVFLKGGGDPRLVHERLWQALRRLQQTGVREIRGDIVLDRSAFAPAESGPADFDGEPWRPHNVQPDALLLNQHAALWTFVPDAARGVARVHADTDGPGMPERTVPLAGGACEDWRSGLRLQPAPAAEGGWRFAGAYPAACGELVWPLADPDPVGYGARLVAALWKELGGRLQGRVREGRLPASARPAFEVRSPPLAEVVRDINKFSNNVMAQQLFLTLALQRNPAVPATAEAAREVLRRWVAERIGEPAPGELVIDNGSGLSRQARMTVQWLAHLLQHAWSSPVMPELLSSLPVTGLDGTLRRARTSPGRAHLKTGSLRDVAGLAGVVLADDGRRLVFVAVVHHPNAGAARPALDALVQWALRGAATR